MVSIRSKKFVRLVVLAALLAVNLVIPAKAREACMKCEWCWHPQGYWYACCPFTSEGGYISCEGDWSLPEGWHCDVGSPCATR